MEPKAHSRAVGGSFRDPAGQVYRRGGRVLRQVHRGFEADYEMLMSSGLYQALVDAGLLLPHRELGLDEALDGRAAKVLEPEPLPFVSYPWEWCFGQLRDAALATLEVQRIALDHGMTLKDASAFNIQFACRPHSRKPDSRKPILCKPVRCKPVFIDTLSFAPWREGEPWAAWLQFCRHFLAPLALAHYRDYRLTGLLRGYIDGIPLDLASGLLPRRSWLRYSMLAHIHLHARAQARYAAASGNTPRTSRVSAAGMRGLVDGLGRAVRRLRRRAVATEWGDYYADASHADTSYGEESMAAKGRLVSELLGRVETGGGLPRGGLRQDPVRSDPSQSDPSQSDPSQSDPLLLGSLLMDMGANTGRFSRLGAERGFTVVALDSDESAVEQAYRECEGVLPLVQDLANPTPALGWAHAERMSLLERGPAAVVMALALIHHLAIANNVPLEHCARFFADAGEHLLIEFVPKADSQVQRLLASRQDIFPDYHQEGFEAAFGGCFDILAAEDIPGTERRLYLMRRRGVEASPA